MKRRVKVRIVIDRFTGQYIDVVDKDVLATSRGSIVAAIVTYDDGKKLKKQKEKR